MEKLIATFNVQLPSYLLVQRPENDEPAFTVRIDNFEVNILFLIQPPNITGMSKKASETNFSFGVSGIRISVGREEKTEPPAIHFTAEGIRDYSLEHEEYFQQRQSAYENVAIEALNRLIRFFKYRLRNPLLHELNIRRNALSEPEWNDETGQEAGQGGGILYLQPVPGLRGFPFGALKLTPDQDSMLQEALEIPVVPELYEEILSDAQAAVFQGNLRRAVLEMAIACEILIKQAFFTKLTPAGEAFEYLEENRHVEITNLELIHKVSKRAFGTSFKETYQQHYRNIDYLFRCRNKVAHRGKALYRDESGKVCEVSKDVFEQWWHSVETLIEWLKEVKGIK